MVENFQKNIGNNTTTGHNKYYPQKGDIVWVDFNPTIGHEQKGKRPALVLSSSKYNMLSGMCIVCPITSIIKPYPFVVLLKKTQKTVGAILSDHLKSIDWSIRKVKFIEKIEKATLRDVEERVTLLLS